jgi:hypothetical protein
MSTRKCPFSTSFRGLFRVFQDFALFLLKFTRPAGKISSPTALHFTPALPDE